MLVGIGPEEGPCWKPCWGASSCRMDEQRRGLSGGEGRGSRALGWVRGWVGREDLSPLLGPLLLAPQQGRLLPMLPAPAPSPCTRPGAGTVFPSPKAAAGREEVLANIY